jgi:hypothetical protein
VSRASTDVHFGGIGYSWIECHLSLSLTAFHCTYPLQISVKECQGRTIRAALLQRIGSAAPMAIPASATLASVSVDSDCGYKCRYPESHSIVKNVSGMVQHIQGKIKITRCYFDSGGRQAGQD